MSRKLTVTLIFFLFLLPFVSWYYLQSGLNWRKQAQDVLHGTDPFSMTGFQNRNGIPIEESNMNFHVSLLSLVGCQHPSDQWELIGKMYAQFKETNKANFIFIQQCADAPLMIPDSLQKGIYLNPCTDSTQSCALLLKNWPAGSTYALVDRSGVIRAYYAAKTDDEKRILVEHMALLLPRDRSEKVELKRGGEKK